MSTVAPQTPDHGVRVPERRPVDVPPPVSAGRQERSIFLADPGPFGLAALALPLAALSWINIGMAKPTAIPVVLTTLLVYGGLGQLLVAGWEAFRGNVFGVVAFGTFGCFNLALWYFFTDQLPKIPLAQHPADLALFLGLWAIPAFILWVASLRTNLVINLIFMFATALFVVAAWGNYYSNSAGIKAAGWIGIALAAVAWYGCASGLLQTTFGRVILPIPDLKGGQRSAGHRTHRHLLPVGK